MKLINDETLLTKLRNKKSIDIINFEISNLQHTSYYFRLGDFCLYKNRTIKLNEEKSFIIEPNSFAEVVSFEKFMFGNDSFAIFSSIKGLIDLNLEIKNSIFVDPLFEGNLKLILYNYGTKEVRINYLQSIGKICFFDVSDTPNINIRKDSVQEDKFKRFKETYGDGATPWLLSDTI